MPQATTIELGEIQTRLQNAMNELRSIQKDVTSNPKLDKHIGKAYAHLSKGHAIATTETQTTD